MSRRGSFTRPRGISQSQRRKKTWISVKAAVATPSAGDSIFTTSFQLPVAQTGASDGSHSEVAFGLIDVGAAGDGDEFSTLPEECTVLRIRGSLLFPNNAFASGDTLPINNHAFGIGVTDIRSIVNSNFPGPIIDSDWDGWMFLRQSALKPLDAQATMMDVKSMRKIKTGDALFFAAQTVNGTGGGGASADWAMDARILVLLP